MIVVPVCGCLGPFNISVCEYCLIYDYFIHFSMGVCVVMYVYLDL